MQKSSSGGSGLSPGPSSTLCELEVVYKPQPADMPPDGTIPWAVRWIMEELRYPPDRAWNLLNREMCMGELTARRYGTLFAPGEGRKLKKLERENLDFDYRRYMKDRQTGGPVGSLWIGRECIHPHAITIPTEEFEHWLALQRVSTQNEGKPRRTAEPRVSDDDPELPELRELIQRRSEARRVWENDPANEAVQDDMWFLQPAITREITQIESDAIPRQQAKPASESRNSELRKLWQWLATLRADEQELLSAGPHDLHSIVDRLWMAYGHLVSPPGPRSRSKERPTVPVGMGAQPAGMSEIAIDQNNVCRVAERQSTPDFRSGAPGRPSGMFLINDELRRRVTAGVALPIFAEEQSWLRQWLTDEHPNVPRPTVKTIKNNPENARIHRNYRETRKAQN
jgi:hypothetical protein